MPPTGSWSSSRRGAARCPPTRPPARSSRSPRRRRRSRARCSTRSSPATRGSPGAAPRSGWPIRRRQRSRSSTPRSSCSTSRPPGSRRPLADRRDRRAAGGRARARRHVRDARQPGRAAAAGDHGPDGHRPRATSAGRRPPTSPCGASSSFAGDAVLVAHNARFDMGFLDRAVERLTGRRVAAPVVDTVWLARRLLERPDEAASASQRSRTSSARRVEPCHRALADAEATAEILIALIGLAQERGAETVADLVELVGAAGPPPPCQALARRGGADDAGHVRLPRRHGQALYVGRARNLSARLRSYFSGERQRPAVEAALGALARVEWQPCGSELEAALDELRLLRELRPPANARGTRPDRHVYLRRRGARWVCGTEPTPHGPICGPVARPAGGAGARRLRRRRPGRCSPGLRQRLRRLAGDLRFEDAARLRDRIAALEQVVDRIDELARLRTMRACLVVPALEPGMVRAVFVAGGRRRRRRTRPASAEAAHRGRCGPGEVDRAARHPTRGDRRGRAPPARDLPAPAAARAARDPARSRRDPCGRERGSLGSVSMRAGRRARPRSRRSPIGSRRRSSGSAASSSSVSTPASTSCRSSSGARRCRDGPPRPQRWSASARGSSTPSHRTRLR